MTFSVHQHWDPLKVCAVGQSYPAHFYNFIKSQKARSVMQRIAEETEEDYQKLINLLNKFGVEIVRTKLVDDPDYYFRNGKYISPPMCPRDYTAMIGDKFFSKSDKYTTIWNNLRDESWPEHMPDRWEQIPESIRDELVNQFGHSEKDLYQNRFEDIHNLVKQQGNEIIYDTRINSAEHVRVGKDLYHGTGERERVKPETQSKYDQLFPEYRNWIVDTQGHCDGFFCAVKPGLIVSLYDKPDYNVEFPGWEVVHLPNESWTKMGKFLGLKLKNGGKWWVPGEENNDEFTHYVTEWIDHWMGYAEETVFDVNMLVIDQENVICNSNNPKVMEAFERHGITPHILNFRHRYFWDGGLHCITSDLDREGQRQDYFPERS